METGVYPDIDADTYHSGPETSISRLKLFSEEGGAAKVMYGERVETPALRFGSLIHSIVMEPDACEARYQVTDLERTGTAAWTKAENEACGRILVKRPEYENALRIRDAVMKNKAARNLLAPGLIVEQSIYWRDEETGVACRGRADGLRPDWMAGVDLKSTEDASQAGVEKSIQEYKYYWQEPFYRDGLIAAGWGELNGFLFIFIEKRAPFLSRVVEIHPDDISLGRDEIRPQLRAWAACEQSGVWPGYPETIEQARLPRWYRAKVGEMLT